VNFRALAAGEPRIRIASVDGRDARNRSVTVLRPAVTVAETPRVTQLAQPHPNPFAQRATIAFSLAAKGPVQLAIYSVDGRRIRLLARDVREAGHHSVTWDGRDDDGAAATAGVYYLHLSTAQGRFTRSMVYTK
jgi:hypothetical protein